MTQEQVEEQVSNAIARAEEKLKEAKAAEIDAHAKWLNCDEMDGSVYFERLAMYYKAKAARLELQLELAILKA